MALARKNRPELESMQTGIEMQQADALRARKEYLPDSWFVECINK